MFERLKTPLAFTGKQLFFRILKWLVVWAAVAAIVFWLVTRPYSLPGVKYLGSFGAKLEQLRQQYQETRTEGDKTTDQLYETNVWILRNDIEKRKLENGGRYDPNFNIGANIIDLTSGALDPKNFSYRVYNDGHSYELCVLLSTGKKCTTEKDPQSNLPSGF